MEEETNMQMTKARNHIVTWLITLMVVFIIFIGYSDGRKDRAKIKQQVHLNAFQNDKKPHN